MFFGKNILSAKFDDLCVRKCSTYAMVFQGSMDRPADTGAIIPFMGAQRVYVWGIRTGYKVFRNCLGFSIWEFSFFLYDSDDK